MAAELTIACCVLARMAGLVFVVPGISMRLVPLRIRALLVILLSASVLCTLPMDLGSHQSADPGILIVHELVVGVSLGLAPAVFVWGLQIATRSVSGMTGLPAGNESPSGLSSGATQQLLTVMVLLIFFTSGGHRQLIQAALLSFEWLPPGRVVPLSLAGELWLDVLAQSFALGVRVIAPIGVTLMISLLTLTLINRVVPQLGYFAVGMSVQNLALIGAFTIFAGSMGWLLELRFPTLANTAPELWQYLLAP